MNQEGRKLSQLRTVVIDHCYIENIDPDNEAYKIAESLWAGFPGNIPVRIEDRTRIRNGKPTIIVADRRDKDVVYVSEGATEQEPENIS